MNSTMVSICWKDGKPAPLPLDQFRRATLPGPLVSPQRKVDVVVGFPGYCADQEGLPRLRSSDSEVKSVHCGIRPSGGSNQGSSMVGESLRVTLVLPGPNIVVNVALRVVVVLQLNRLTSSNSPASRGAFQKSAGRAGTPSRLWLTSNQFQMLRVLSPFLTAHPARPRHGSSNRAEEGASLRALPDA